MLEMNLESIRKQEFKNVENTGKSIAMRIRGIEISSSYKIISAAYGAYLAKINKIMDGKELINYIRGNLKESTQYFLRDQTNDIFWESVIEISKEYTAETLLAVVLWFPTTEGRHSIDRDTPLGIIKLVNMILEPQNEQVADFCCGSGNFLSYVAEKNENVSLYGIEIDTQQKEISNIRISLLSDNALVEQGTVFSVPAEKKYAKIFCDYPWGIRLRDKFSDVEHVGEIDSLIPEVERLTTFDWMFIANVIAHLSDDGKAVVITTNGITLNGGLSKNIRERLIKRGLIEAVIALPGNLYQTTGISTSILVLSKKNTKVRFIDATDMATKGRRQNELNDKSINKIAKMMLEESSCSMLVDLKKLEENDYVFNPSRYLQTEIKVEDGVPFESVIKSITRGAQVKASELDKLVSEEPTDYQYLMLANIQDGMINEDLPYIKELDKKLEKYCIKNNNLIISKNGIPVKVAVASVEDGKKILGNGNLYIVELDTEQVDPYFVKAYLESENGMVALSRILVGTMLPNIPVDGLKRLQIPVPSKLEQKRIVDKYVAKMDEIRVLRYKLQKATAELKTIFEEG